MTNPTSNFGWQMPTSTDLVTDLPADFEVFGQAVDTSLADLKGGTTGQVLSKASNTDMDFTWAAPTTGDITGVSVTSPITGGGTSGDVTIGISSSAVVPSQTGNSGKYLTTDGTTSSWGTISAGGLTLISSTTFNNTANSVNITGISSSYKYLYITASGLSSNSNGQVMRVTFNGDTSGSYFYNTVQTTNALSMEGGQGQTSIEIGGIADTADASSRYSRIQMTIPNYTSSVQKSIFFTTSGQPSGTNTGRMGSGGWNNTNAITQLTILLSGSANWKTGIMTIYGGN